MRRPSAAPTTAIEYLERERKFLENQINYHVKELEEYKEKLQNINIIIAENKADLELLKTLTKK